MRKLWLLSFVLTLVVGAATAQSKSKAKPAPAVAAADNTDSVFFAKIKYRQIGPFRGGRSGAVTGSYKNKNTFYFGATGGGIWKTQDGGSNWKNVSNSNIEFQKSFSNTAFK